MSSTQLESLRLASMCWHPPRYLNLLVYASILVAVLAPLTIIDIPFLADYPNHVARMHILGNINTDPLLGERYISTFDFTPNIAMDFIIPSLTQAIPLDLAGRLFLALTLLSTLTGVALLHRAIFNHWCLWPLMTTLFLYHGSFMAGLANFSLGAGLVPGALAIWIMIRHTPPSRRAAIGSLMAVILFFCHLVAFAAYGLLVIGYEYARARDKWSRRDGPSQAARDFLVAGITGLVPTLLTARQLLQSETFQTTERVVAWGNLSWKAKALLAPLANYNPGLDLASLAILGGLAVWGWRSGRLDIDRRLAPGLGLLLLGFLLAPKALWTGGVFDQRFAIVFAFIFIGGTRFRVDGIWTGLVLPTLLAGLFLLRLGVIMTAWSDHRTDLAEIRSTLDLVEPGSRILVVQPDDTAGITQAPARHIVFHHAAQMASLPVLAVIDRSAFVSTIYAIPGQHTIRLQAPFDRLNGESVADVPTLAELAEATRTGQETVSAQLRDWWTSFDYVMLIYGYGKNADHLRAGLPLETLRDGDIADLFKIETTIR